MGKRKHKKDKDDAPECKIAEEVMSEIFEDAKKRRIIARKPDGEVVFELPTVGFMVLIGVLLFFFPLFVIAAIAAYKNKIHISVIRELTDEEEAMLDSLETQDTLIGDPYDRRDGQATIVYDVN